MPKQGQWLQPEGEGREEGGMEEGSPNPVARGRHGGRETSSINSIAHVFGMAVQGVRAGWAYSETVVSQGTTLMQRVRHSPGS